MKLNLYTCDYWVPFPSSEYGGLVIFAANDTQEVLELAKEMTCRHDMRGEKSLFDDLFIELIGTTDLFEGPCVVEGFVT